MDNIIKLLNITKHFYSKKKTYTALENISFTMNHKTVLGIKGESGSGKSTLLSLLAGLTLPSKGKILVNNQNISDFSSKELDVFRKKDIGIVFQEYNLLNFLNITDNIALANRIKDNISLKAARVNAYKLLRSFNLSEISLKKPFELSGGEKQRVAILRCLAKKPTLFLFDEPTSSLDQKNSKLVVDTLFRLIKTDNISLIISSNDETILDLCNTTLTLKKGKLLHIK